MHRGVPQVAFLLLNTIEDEEVVTQTIFALTQSLPVPLHFSGALIIPKHSQTIRESCDVSGL